MRVLVETPSRLHLGIMDLSGDLGRIYGSIGVAIDKPNVVLEATPSDRITTSGEEAEKTRLLAEKFFKHYKPGGGAHISVRQTIPEHVGLGSGTQLSLAVAASLAKLFELSVPTTDLASAMGRGPVSGVGTAAFEHGGFLIDGGHKLGRLGLKPSVRGIPPLVFQSPFPEAWRFVVAIPNIRRGLSGEEEEQVFRALPRAPPESVGRISRLVLMGLLPALVEGDIGGFGKALTQIQFLVGENFRKAQGGRFSSPVVGECVKLMLEEGAYGAGQSSWGPTVYGLVEGEGMAKRLKAAVEEFMGERVGGKVFSAAPNNRGARIEVAED
ncbi:MAG: beta-ribofuranosylaminobenzene 5'-phosphate synthase family protein [Candidatus Geothermarchaeales archaeon]